MAVLITIEKTLRDEDLTIFAFIELIKDGKTFNFPRVELSADEFNTCLLILTKLYNRPQILEEMGEGEKLTAFAWDIP